VLPARAPLSASAPVPAKGEPARPSFDAAREAGAAGKDGRPTK